MANIQIIQGNFEKKLKLQFAPGIKAGFPSPADDYSHETLDFNRDLIRNPEATFYGKVDNNSYNSLKLPFISISAKFGKGIEELEQAIYEAADIPTLTENDIIVTNARHYDALVRAHEHIQRVIDGLQMQLSGDLLSEDLRLTLDTLAEITGGQITPNEVLGNIFKNFCVGK